MLVCSFEMEFVRFGVFVFFFGFFCFMFLRECGIFNASAGGTMYCRDTYTTKNVENGDTVKVYYTGKFQRP